MTSSEGKTARECAPGRSVVLYVARLSSNERAAHNALFVSPRVVSAPTLMRLTSGVMFTPDQVVQVTPDGSVAANELQMSRITRHFLKVEPADWVQLTECTDAGIKEGGGLFVARPARDAIVYAEESAFATSLLEAFRGQLIHVGAERIFTFEDRAFVVTMIGIDADPGPDLGSASGPDLGSAPGPGAGPAAGPGTGPAAGPGTGPDTGPAAGPGTGPDHGPAGLVAGSDTGPAPGDAPGAAIGPSTSFGRGARRCTPAVILTRMPKLCTRFVTDDSMRYIVWARRDLT